MNILNGATAEGNKTIEQLKNEEKIKQTAIDELIKNPNAEIRKAVIEQIPEEQKEKVAKAFSDIFELDYEKTLKKVKKKSSIETIVRKMDKEKVLKSIVEVISCN